MKKSRQAPFSLFVAALSFTLFSVAMADSPPLDGSSGFFSGEWSGTGAMGAYCYLNLDIDGTGHLLIDGGAGDWLGSRVLWRNRRQALEISYATPLPVSTQLRVMPLSRFSVTTEFNQSLWLTWSQSSGGCRLQKREAMESRLEQARSTVRRLPHPALAK